MAFDLNKNDGSDKGTSNKTQSTSKFDLSKSDAATTIITNPASSSKKWIIGLVGILMLGGGIWFYSSKDAGSKVNTNPVGVVVPTDSSSNVILDTAGTGQPSIVEKDTSSQTASTIVDESNDKNVPVEAANLSNKTAASFAQGSSALSRVDQSLLERIVSYLTKNPDATINIIGYASSDGSLSVNQLVSQSRAEAFKRLLMSKTIAESRITAIGKGIQNPIASNATNSGRKRNRRIEIALK
jgi:outer membrane protein OmpA-like peptidoglycan-associated protein